MAPEESSLDRMTKRSLIPVYTHDMIDIHVQRAGLSPYVHPTASSNENLVLGRTPGLSRHPAHPADPPIPRLKIYGYRICSELRAVAEKKMVLAACNHGNEHSGSWLLQGAVDFLLGDDKRAQQLRRHVEFFVYPSVNPEGRYIAVNRISLGAAPDPEGRNRFRGNPQLYIAGEADNNRVWNTDGRFTNIDIVKNAMKKDTGGKADYFWDLHDLHDPGNWRSPGGREAWESPYGRALRARGKDVVVAGLPEGHKPGLYRPGLPAHSGKLSEWAMLGEGLAAPYSFVYESGEYLQERLIQAGEDIVLALYDSLAS